MGQGRCMKLRHDLRQDYSSATLGNVTVEGLLILHGCSQPVRKAEPTQAERKRIATATKPRQRTVYGPADYAKSVPAERPGTKSTVGVTVIHSGPNRAAKRANAAASRHTSYAPRTAKSTVAIPGTRSISRRQSREAQLVTMARQNYAFAAERRRRIAQTAARNAKMAAVVAGLETDSATWK